MAWEADDGEKSTSAVLVEQKKATTSTSASIRVSAGLVEQNSKEAHGGEKSGLHHWRLESCSSLYAIPEVYGWFL